MDVDKILCCHQSLIIITSSLITPYLMFVIVRLYLLGDEVQLALLT
jgi:hypothetical protein